MKIIETCIAVFLISFFLTGCKNTASNSSSQEKTKKIQQTITPVERSKENSKQDEFNQKAKEKFGKVAQEIPELSNKGIYCFEDDCSLVYFDFASIPDDLEMIIRSNTAILSKEKKEITGVSHVTIIATKNGQTIFTCGASRGKVDKCE